MPPSTLRPDAIVAVIRTRSAAAGSTQASYSKSYSKLFGRVNVGSGVAAKALRHQLLHLDAAVVPCQDSAVRNEAQKRPLGVVGLSGRRNAGSLSLTPASIRDMAVASSTTSTRPVRWTARSSVYRSPDSTRKDARGSCRTRAIFLVPAGVIIAIL